MMEDQQGRELMGEETYIILKVFYRNVGILPNIQRKIWLEGWLTQKLQNLQPTGASYSGHVEISRSIILYYF